MHFGDIPYLFRPKYKVRILFNGYRYLVQQKEGWFKSWTYISRHDTFSDAELTASLWLKCYKDEVAGVRKANFNRRYCTVIKTFSVSRLARAQAEAEGTWAESLVRSGKIKKGEP